MRTHELTISKDGKEYTDILWVCVATGKLKRNIRDKKGELITDNHVLVTETVTIPKPITIVWS